MLVVITASGGGHTGYAVALAQHLVGRAEMLFIIPRGDAWTRSKVERMGRVVEVTKARRPNQPLATAVPGLVRAFFESLGAVPRGATAFVSSGSNHSVPPALAAWLKGVPVVNLESSVRFTSLSSSFRALKRFARLNVLQWEEQLELCPDGVVVGPLYEKPLYEPRDEGYVLVTGGTYGHRQLFDAVSRLGIENVVLQTGRVDPEPYRKRHPGWRVFRFDPDFQRWIAGASIVVTHLGKTVIDSALSYGKPTVIVPNPEWRLTAGWRDAEILAEKLNAVLVREISPEAIEEAIREARRRSPRRYRNGAEELARILLEELGSAAKPHTK